MSNQIRFDFSGTASSSGVLLLAGCMSAFAQPGNLSGVDFYQHNTIDAKPIVFRTSATNHSADVLSGTIGDTDSSLLSDAAITALGEFGLKRLHDFGKLLPGWDGPRSSPLNLRSVVTFSRFFQDTGIRPEGLGVFMSPTGNVAVNWVAHAGSFVEIEFHPNQIHYFVEKTGNEDLLPSDDIGFTKLLNILRNNKLV